MIKPWNFTIYYRKREETFFFFLLKISVQIAEF